MASRHTFFFVLFCLVLCEDAYHHNNIAMHYANQHNYEIAIQHFIRARDALPSNPTFHNNVGVTYMRMGEFEKAHKSFRDALEIDPVHSDALENMEILLDYYSPPEINEKYKKSPHLRLPLPHIHKNTISQGSPRFLHKQAPFLLVGVNNSWDTNMWTLDWLSSNFGENQADYYPHNMAKENARPYLGLLKDAIEDFQHPTGRFMTDPKNPGSYIQWNLNFPTWSRLLESLPEIPSFLTEADWWMKQCFPTEELVSKFALATHWWMVLIGSKNAGMFNHLDLLRTASWQVQITGEKRWHLCGPTENKFMYGAGDVNAFNPDYKNYPRFRNAQCYDEIVKPGQIIFYSHDWWHQTLNLETPSIALSGTIVDENNFEQVKEKLREECFGSQPRIGTLTNELCSILEEKCFPLWGKELGKLKADKEQSPHVKLPLPRFTVTTLQNAPNFAYSQGYFPFILEDAGISGNSIEEWEAMRREWSLSNLSSKFGQSLADFYPHNMAKSDVHPFIVSLHDALQEFENPSGRFPSDSSSPGTYIQWNIMSLEWEKLMERKQFSLEGQTGQDTFHKWWTNIPDNFRMDDSWLEQCFPDREILDEFLRDTHWRMLLIGSEGAGMFNHVDVLQTGSWQLQIIGSKVWHLCGPQESAYMYDAGDVDTFNPDYDRFPAFQKATCFEAEVKPGELIYYPRDYWHQTRNIVTPSVSISGTIVDKSNFNYVRDQLFAKCSSSAEYPLSTHVCRLLPACFEKWDKVYA